jgi:hypothetical protein
MKLYDYQATTVHIFIDLYSSYHGLYEYDDRTNA